MRVSLCVHTVEDWALLLRGLIQQWRGGGATGGSSGLELYHCELIPLFTEERKRQKEEKEQRAV